MVVFYPNPICKSCDENHNFSKKRWHAFIEGYAGFLSLQTISECKYTCLISPECCVNSYYYWPGNYSTFPIWLLVLSGLYASLKPDVQHLIYFHYLTWSRVFIISKSEAGTVGLCCALHDLGLLQWPTGLIRQNTVCCEESTSSEALPGYDCLEPLETRAKKS